MRSLAILLYSIPTSLLLFCWVTMGMSATYDGDLGATYGFPLNWYTPVFATSGGNQIAVGRLIVDLATYILLSHLVWSVLKSVVAIPAIAARLLKTLLSLGAVASLLITVVLFASDAHFRWWELFPTSIEKPQGAHYFVFVGLQPGPAQPDPVSKR